MNGVSIGERGMPGAMDTMVQCGKIQDESLAYEHRNTTDFACALRGGWEHRRNT